MFFKLSVLVEYFILCVLILPVMESRKSINNKTSKFNKLIEVKPDRCTCDFQGFEGPEDDGKNRRKNKVNAAKAEKPSGISIDLATLQRLEVRGPVPSVFTPFTDDGEVNYSVIPKYVKHLNSTGATAIVVGGRAGDYSMNVCERKKVTEVFVKEAEKYGIKIIVNVGSVIMSYVLELARHAEKLGVAGILTTPPICSIKLKTVENLIWYLTVIGKNAPSLPLLYYHFPEFTGVYVITNIRDFHTKMSTQVGNYKGMVTTFLVALDIADLVRRDQEIFINSYHVASAACMGFKSSISPVHNIALKQVHQILNAVKTGDSKKGRKLQLKLNKIVAEIKAVAEFVPATKASMEMISDIEVGPVRPPQPRITDEERKSIHDILESNDIQTNSFIWE